MDAPTADAAKIQVGQPASMTDRVLKLLPVIRERASQNEDARQLLDANFEDLRAIGFFRAVVPKAFGGLEMDIRDWLEAVRLLSSADPATGWTAGVLGVHGHPIAYFDDRVHQEIWGALGPDAIISSSAAAEGEAEVVDGGLRVSGRWRFSSGVDRANWVMLAAKIPNKTTGAPDFFLFVVPRSDFEIDDTWRVSGLRGTGSKDVVVKGAFVPGYRLLGPGYENMIPPHPARTKSPYYSVPLLTVFTSIFAAIALGAGEGALALWKDKLVSRVRPHTGQKSVESAAALMRIGESTLELRAAAALVERHWDRLRDFMTSGEPMEPRLVGEWRGEDCYVGWLAIRAVDRIMNSAGGSSLYASNPLQRYWRDIHAVGAHVWFDLDAALEVYGREVLGLPEKLNLT